MSSAVLPSSSRIPLPVQPSPSSDQVACANTSDEKNTSWKKTTVKVLLAVVAVLGGGLATYGIHRAWIEGAREPTRLRVPPTSVPSEDLPTSGRNEDDGRARLLRELDIECKQVVEGYCYPRVKFEIKVDYGVEGPLGDSFGNVLLDPKTLLPIYRVLKRYSLNSIQDKICLSDHNPAFVKVEVKEGHIHCPVELKASEVFDLPQSLKMDLLLDEAQTRSLRRVLPNVAQNCIDLNTAGKTVRCTAFVKPVGMCDTPEVTLT